MVGAGVINDMPFQKMAYVDLQDEQRYVPDAPSATGGIRKWICSLRESVHTTDDEPDGEHSITDTRGVVARTTRNDEDIESERIWTGWQ